MTAKSVKVDCAVPVGAGAAVTLASFLPSPFTNADFAYTGYLTAIGTGTITIVAEVGTGTLINTQCEYYEGVNLRLMSVYGSTTGLTLCIGGSH